MRRLVPPTGPATTTRWWAGLSITCSATGQARDAVGYVDRPDGGTVHPGDRVGVYTTGGKCLSLIVAVSAPHTTTVWDIGAGCRAGTHEQIRVLLPPTMLIGADLNRPGPPQATLTLRSLMINAQPYWMAPHALRYQIAHAIHVVQAARPATSTEPNAPSGSARRHRTISTC